MITPYQLLLAVPRRSQVVASLQRFFARIFHPQVRTEPTKPLPSSNPAVLRVPTPVPERAAVTVQSRQRIALDSYSDVYDAHSVDGIGRRWLADATSSPLLAVEATEVDVDTEIDRSFDFESCGLGEASLRMSAALDSRELDGADDEAENGRR